MIEVPPQFASSISGSLYIQEYTKKAKIEGVKLIPLTNHITEDGDFSELLRLNPQGELELVPGFKLAQVNRSRLLPGTIKGWHLHTNQDEVWYVPPTDQLVVGLWDVRQDSPSQNVSQKIALGGGNSAILYIPRGVAHGLTTQSPQPVNLYYFMNQQFDVNTPDEYRLPWDSLGADFWQPQRD